MVKAIESRTVARLPPTWLWMLMAVTISSRSSDFHAADEVVQRGLQGHAQAHLAHDALELLGDRRLRLARHELDALQERRAGAERVGEQGDGVRAAAR